MAGRGQGLTLRYYPGICLDGLRKTTKNGQSELAVSSRGSNWAGPAYVSANLFHVSVLISFLVWGGTHKSVHLVRPLLSGLLYQPRMINGDECGAVDGI
jgi:hypothetical protein